MLQLPDEEGDAKSVPDDCKLGGPAQSVGTGRGQTALGFDAPPLLRLSPQRPETKRRPKLKATVGSVLLLLANILLFRANLVHMIERRSKARR